jgi:hypothetical protein
VNALSDTYPTDDDHHHQLLRASRLLRKAQPSALCNQGELRHVVPQGHAEKAPVWVFSTWSEHSDGTKKKSFIDIKGTVSIDSKHRFSVKGGDYYAFDGVFPMDRNDGALEVTLKGYRGFVAVFTSGPPRGQLVVFTNAIE